MVRRQGHAGGQNTDRASVFSFDAFKLYRTGGRSFGSEKSSGPRSASRPFGNHLGLNYPSKTAKLDLGTEPRYSDASTVSTCDDNASACAIYEGIGGRPDCSLMSTYDDTSDDNLLSAAHLAKLRQPSHANRQSLGRCSVTATYDEIRPSSYLSAIYEEIRPKPLRPLVGTALLLIVSNLVAIASCLVILRLDAPELPLTDVRVNEAAHVQVEKFLSTVHFQPSALSGNKLALFELDCNTGQKHYCTLLTLPGNPDRLAVPQTGYYYIYAKVTVNAKGRYCSYIEVNITKHRDTGEDVLIDTATASSADGQLLAKDNVTLYMARASLFIDSEMVSVKVKCTGSDTYRIVSHASFIGFHFLGHPFA